MTDRLISADKLREDVLDLPNCPNGYSDTYDKEWIFSLVDEQPTVDAIPVVHCKDCKWYESDHLKRDGTMDKRYKSNVCVRGTFAKLRKADWYCADGERREDNDNRTRGRR